MGETAMGLEFNRKSRELFVRSILIEMKGRIAGEYADWNVEFSRTHIAEGFGYHFSVKAPENSEWFVGRFARKEEFYAIKNFMTSMSDYLFGRDIETCIMSDAENMTIEIELSSF